MCLIANILEKLVLSQVSFNLKSHNLYNTCQSAYRPGHSTETALLKVVYDLFLSLRIGSTSVLSLLDFSSALDKIDHTILVHRLHTDFGYTDIVIQWSSYYLTMTHYVSLYNHCSALAPVHSGVPHGSVLGPMLFTMYIKPLSAIIDSHSATHHSLADDLQLHMYAPQIEYQSYFTIGSHVLVMSMLGQLRTCLGLMTVRQNSCLSPLKELRISIAYLLQSLWEMPSNSL